MSTVQPTPDNLQTHEQMLTYALVKARDAVDAYPNLGLAARRVVLTAFAGLLADLRAAGVIR